MIIRIDVNRVCTLKTTVIGDDGNVQKELLPIEVGPEGATYDIFIGRQVQGTSLTPRDEIESVSE